MPHPDIALEVGLLVAHSPVADPARLRAFAVETTAAAAPELVAATGARWTFHAVEAAGLPTDEPRRPSDFLDEASLQMAEGPFDFVLVVTDVGLTSPPRGIVAGLASPASGVAVISTRRLTVARRGERGRSLEHEAVRMNATALVLHLIGHLLHLPHSREPDTPMAPFRVDPKRRAVPVFGARERRALTERCRRFPEPLVEGGLLRRFWFHVVSAARHSGTLWSVLKRNRAPLLPLSLPSLATAAVAPTFLLVFTAEIWDAGLNMPVGVVLFFAAVSIVAAAWYLTAVQDLFFPREEKRRITEHMALVNVAILLTVLLALIGLLVMVGLLMLFVETYIFPPGLISTWPTLEDPQVDLVDKVRLAAFISVIGVLTGALAGGLESRTVIRHLALFLREP